MISNACKFDLVSADLAFDSLRSSQKNLSWYIRPLGEYLRNDNDLILQEIDFDNSWASIWLWNFLLSENERLRSARNKGEKIIGCMKDLGTIPVMAYSLENVRAFYPDGTWWTPCVMKLSDGLFFVSTTQGCDISFCPVRAMLGAFINEEHFPIPDLLICSTGAVCDDFSAISQRLYWLGYDIKWWEVPRRRCAEFHEESVELPSGLIVPRIQVDFIKSELKRVFKILRNFSRSADSDIRLLSDGIRKANQIRRMIMHLRNLIFSSRRCPLPALEELIMEMMAIHFCSDREECLLILKALTEEVERRISLGQSVLSEDCPKVYLVNPVSDIRMMNLIEDCGLRVCGTDFMFTHALELIPEDIDPFDALARMVLSDPMVGPAEDRCKHIIREALKYRVDAVVIVRIPGASHCAWECKSMSEKLKAILRIPVLDVEVPTLVNSIESTLKSRLEAISEIVHASKSI